MAPYVRTSPIKRKGKRWTGRRLAMHEYNEITLALSTISTSESNVHPSYFKKACRAANVSSALVSRLVQYVFSTA